MRRTIRADRLGIMDESRSVGFIGVGNMGGAMALRLRELGWAVGVRDIVPAREAECARAGATTAPTAGALAGGRRVVVVAGVGGGLCEGVFFGSAGVGHGGVDEHRIALRR